MFHINVVEGGKKPHTHAQREREREREKCAIYEIIWKNTVKPDTP